MNELVLEDIGNGEFLKKIGPFTYIEAECQIWCVATYNKCSFRCTYCNTLSQGRSVPAFDSTNIPELIQMFKPFSNIRPLMVGGQTDPYPPEEKQYRITRCFLKELTEHEISFRFVTKGDGVLDDLDLLQNNPFLEMVTITITSNDNAFLKQHEPGAPDYETRINVVNKLHSVGIPVSVTICPWMPELTPLVEILDALPEKVPVSIGVLNYNHHALQYMKHMFNADVSTAERVFGQRWSQSELIECYLAEYERLKDVYPSHIRWTVPPGSGSTFAAYLPLGNKSRN